MCIIRKNPNDLRYISFQQDKNNCISLTIYFTLNNDTKILNGNYDHQIYTNRMNILSLCLFKLKKVNLIIRMMTYHLYKTA